MNENWVRGSESCKLQASLLGDLEDSCVLFFKDSEEVIDVQVVDLVLVQLLNNVLIQIHLPVDVLRPLVVEEVFKLVSDALRYWLTEVVRRQCPKEPLQQIFFVVFV
jgi:hypothetical protein